MLSTALATFGCTGHKLNYDYVVWAHPVVSADLLDSKALNIRTVVVNIHLLQTLTEHSRSVNGIGTVL